METSFTGVLVRRDYKPGQDYVQLIFKGAHETKLSISKNIMLMKSLTIGEKYRLVGREYKYGSKSYIREPKAIPLSAPKSTSRKKILLIASIATVLATLTSGVAYAALQNGTAAPSTPAVNQQAADNKSDVLPATTEESTANTPVATPETSPSTITPAKPKVLTKSPSAAVPSNPAPSAGSTNPSATDTNSATTQNQETTVTIPVEETPDPIVDIPPASEESGEVL